MSMRLGISRRCRPEPKDFFSDGTRRFGTTTRRLMASVLPSEVLVEAFVVKRRSPHPPHRDIRPRADHTGQSRDNGRGRRRQSAEAPRSAAVEEDHIPRGT